MKSPSLQGKMKDVALCKLPLSLTENSQGWDKNNNNNANVTDMTITQHKNAPDDHEEWVARGSDNRVWRQMPCHCVWTLGKLLKASPSYKLRKPWYPAHWLLENYPS